MPNNEITIRFDEFQKEAVECIERDFRANPTGRYLLVIPTGGGKTYTAVKAINGLFELRVLNPDVDIVVWLAHRIELVRQAEDTLVRFEQEHQEKSYKRCIHVDMLSQLETQLSTNTGLKLVVIDEAHHAAANSYQSAFLRHDLGILGLTATPSRHDGQPLGFDRESFSIGFPDLVRRGIVLRPEIRTVTGGRYEFTFEDEEAGLAQLDNSERNGRIISELLARHGDYEKILIFVGTRDHVGSLHSALMGSPLTEHYQSITWITGEGNSARIGRAEFIAARKAERRSIIVNVDVLSEGYDDPAINTIVMAAPTRSKLQYMQAMGRAIRHDPENEAKTAYIVEVVDELPNIRYRIDNRWLYADVSDALEPAVVDVGYTSASDLADQLSNLYNEYNVSDENRRQFAFDENDRYSMLLFKVYVGQGGFQHIPIHVSRANRLRVVNAFDYLSEQMPRMRGQVNWRVAMNRADANPIDIFGGELQQRLIFDAMSNSTDVRAAETSARPWITFVSFRRQPSRVSEELRRFCEEMVNSQQVLDLLENRDYVSGDVLLRMPLPLGRSVGVIVNAVTHIALAAFLTGLTNLKNQCISQDHHSVFQQFIDQAVFPMQSRFLGSAVLIARDDLDYYRSL